VEGGVDGGDGPGGAGGQAATRVFGDRDDSVAGHELGAADGDGGSVEGAVDFEEVAGEALAAGFLEGVAGGHGVLAVAAVVLVPDPDGGVVGVDGSPLVGAGGRVDPVEESGDAVTAFGQEGAEGRVALGGRGVDGAVEAVVLLADATDQSWFQAGKPLVFLGSVVARGLGFGAGGELGAAQAAQDGAGGEHGGGHTDPAAAATGRGAGLALESAAVLAARLLGAGLSGGFGGDGLAELAGDAHGFAEPLDGGAVAQLGGRGEACVGQAVGRHRRDVEEDFSGGVGELLVVVAAVPAGVVDLAVGVDAVGGFVEKDLEHLAGREVEGFAGDEDLAAGLAVGDPAAAPPVAELHELAAFDSGTEADLERFWSPSSTR